MKWLILFFFFSEILGLKPIHLKHFSIYPDSRFPLFDHEEHLNYPNFRPHLPIEEIGHLKHLWVVQVDPSYVEEHNCSSAKRYDGHSFLCYASLQNIQSLKEKKEVNSTILLDRG